MNFLNVRQVGWRCLLIPAAFAALILISESLASAGIGREQQKALEQAGVVHAGGVFESLVKDNHTDDSGTGTDGNDTEHSVTGTTDHDSDDNGTGTSDIDSDDSGVGTSDDSSTGTPDITGTSTGHEDGSGSGDHDVDHGGSGDGDHHVLSTAFPLSQGSDNVAHNNQFWSPHDGSVSFALADGSVHSLNTAMDHSVLQSVSTRRGLELAAF